MSVEMDEFNRNCKECWEAIQIICADWALRRDLEKLGITVEGESLL